jgi:hypothetical protein
MYVCACADVSILEYVSDDSENKEETLIPSLQKLHIELLIIKQMQARYGNVYEIEDSVNVLADDVPADEGPTSAVPDFETQRAAQILRNKNELIALGLPALKTGICGVGSLLQLAKKTSKRQTEDSSDDDKYEDDENDGTNWAIGSHRQMEIPVDKNLKMMDSVNVLVDDVPAHERPTSAVIDFETQCVAMRLRNKNVMIALGLPALCRKTVLKRKLTDVQEAADRALLKRSLLTALKRQDRVRVPDMYPRDGLPHFHRLIVAATRPGAQLGPGPRCRFCLVLLKSVEWQLERCMVHWDVDIADCPASEASLLANYEQRQC